MDGVGIENKNYFVYLQFVYVDQSGHCKDSSNQTKRMNLLPN